VAGTIFIKGYDPAEDSGSAVASAEAVPIVAARRGRSDNPFDVLALRLGPGFALGLLTV